MKKNGKYTLVNELGQLHECRLTESDVKDLEKRLKEMRRKYKIVEEEGCRFIFINS